MTKWDDFGGGELKYIEDHDFNGKYYKSPYNKQLFHPQSQI